MNTNQTTVLANFDAEFEVIAALISSPDQIDTLSLVAEDFASPECREIYLTMKVMADKSEAIDAITIVETLPANGFVARAGGLAWIGNLIQNTVGRAAGVKSYADIVKKYSVDRKIAAIGTDIHLLAAEKSSQPDEKLARADSLLSSLVLNETQSKTAHIHPAIEQHLVTLQSREGAGIPGMSTGIDDLDVLIGGFQTKNLYILGARPSMGKTSLATGFATHVARLSESAVTKGPHGVLFASQEMPTVNIVDRIMSSLGSINLTHLIRGALTDDDFPRLSAAISKIHEAPLWIDDRSALTLAQIRAMLRERKKDNIKFLVVDYLQLMQAPGQTRSEQIGALSRGMKQIAKDFDIAVLLLSQLSRKVEERADKRPINSDLRESGEIEQDADVIMFAYRDEVYKPDTQDKGIAEILVTKNRNGPLGVVRTAFRGEYTRFDNLSSSYMSNG